MKVVFKETADKEEPEVLILASRKTPELEELINRLSGLCLGPIPAFLDERAVLVGQGEILRFFTDGKGVSVQTVRGTFSVRKRLYELEECLDARTFVRVSNSEIINLKKVAALDLSLTGTIQITLEGGAIVYTSRRYVKKIKRALGI